MDCKIFEFEVSGEREWMAAKSIVQAIKFYHSIVDITELDDDDNIEELPREKWSEMEVSNTDYDKNDPEDWQIKTFEEFVKEEIMELPCMIAGTHYD